MGSDDLFQPGRAATLEEQFHRNRGEFKEGLYVLNTREIVLGELALFFVQAGLCLLELAGVLIEHSERNPDFTPLAALNNRAHDGPQVARSEERRVGKGCRSTWRAKH